MTPADKVIIVGAGMAGIAMAVQLKRQLSHENFEIFEQMDDVGGTWAQNTYPNLSCDVASQFYSYSFFQNPNWSETFASQPEILAYIKDCVHRFELRPHIQLRQKCLSSRWSDEEQLWAVTFIDLDTNKEYCRRARFLVTAVGVLNVPKGLDDIPILRGFKGEIFHTSTWRDISFQNKNVMVLGNGCSANQVIPWILVQGKAKSLVQLVRSEQWVAPKGNEKNSSQFKWILRNIPFACTAYRLWTATSLDLGIFAFQKNTLGNWLRQSMTDGIRSYMTSTAAPLYHDILIPKYDFGAKRPVMDHGYLAITNMPNFRLIKCDGVKAVSEDGRVIVDNAGGAHLIDIVILANGFKTQELLTPMEIRGQTGTELRNLWREKGGARAYMGVCISGFPNLFLLTGPNTLPNGNSTLHGIECSVRYISRLLRPMLQNRFLSRRTKCCSIMPTVAAENSYNSWVQRHLKNLVYTPSVSSWYIDPRTGRNTLIWPGSQFSFWWSRCIAWVRWGDFEFAREKQA